jgi:tryptophan-rich sensory protein
MKPNYVIIPLITIAVAVVGSFITSGGMAWYRSITLPSWTPPGSVIGTVWTVLFILATISALIVWNGAPHDARLRWIIAIFLLNAVLNIGWSLLFFGAHQMGAAVWEAGVLGLTVVALVIFIWPLSTLAALLLVPYAGWVAFATYLTYSVWRLNLL